ncbi:hypothetical protein ACWDYK_21130, partial [Streptomyces anthocyanicus]
MEQDLAELGLSDTELREAITRTQQLLAEAYGQILSRESEGREPGLPVSPERIGTPRGTTEVADGSLAAAPTAKAAARNVASPKIPRSFLDSPSSAVGAQAAQHVDDHVDDDRVAAREDKAREMTVPGVPAGGPAQESERGPEVVRVTRTHPHRSGSISYEFANDSIRLPDGWTLPARGWQPHGQDFVHLGTGAYFHSDTEWIEHLTDDQVLTDLDQIIGDAKHYNLTAHDDTLRFTPIASDTVGSENTSAKGLAHKFLIEAHKIMWERNVEQLPVPGGITRANPNLLSSVRDEIALALSRFSRREAEDLATTARIVHDIAAPRATGPGGAPRQRNYAPSRSAHGGADPVAGLVQGMTGMAIQQPPQPPTSTMYGRWAHYGVWLNTDVSLHELSALRSNPTLTWMQRQAVSHLYERARSSTTSLRQDEFHRNLPFQSLTRHTDPRTGIVFYYDPADTNFKLKFDATMRAIRRVHAAGFRIDQPIAFAFVAHNQRTEIKRDINGLSVHTASKSNTFANYRGTDFPHILVTNKVIELEQDPATRREHASLRPDEGAPALSVFEAFQNPAEVIITHELGHFYDLSHNPGWRARALRESELPPATTVSDYSTKDLSEFVAEIFAKMVFGADISPGAREKYLRAGGPLPTAPPQPLEAPSTEEQLPRLERMIKKQVPDSTREEIRAIHQQFSAHQRLLHVEIQADMIEDRMGVNRKLRASGESISHEKEFSQARPPGGGGPAGKTGARGDQTPRDGTPREGD